jgi:hypothetical protein
MESEKEQLSYLDFVKLIEEAVLMDPKDLIDQSSHPYSWNAALAIARALSLPCPDVEKWRESPVVYCILHHRDHAHSGTSESGRPQVITLIRLLEEAWQFYEGLQLGMAFSRLPSGDGDGIEPR